jgi:cyclophilin family peptidyl-prolyl cis-trans isomerase
VVAGGASTLDADLSSGGYSLFGQVTSGLNVVSTINSEGSSAGSPDVTQRMLSVTITVS